jgi:diacylglycerol kinase (ATP)
MIYSHNNDAIKLKNKGMFKRLSKAGKYSLQGLHAAWQHEAAFRTEIMVIILAVILLLITPSFTTIQNIVLLGVWVLPLILELINSAIEAVVDLASPTIHPLAGRAKDMASAAVFISVLFAIAVWGLIAVPVWLS